MQTGTLTLNGLAFEIQELTDVGLLKFKIWAQDEAARRYAPFRWWLAHWGLARPILPPVWFVARFELSAAGARGLASLMASECPGELITEANAADVTCYLMEHRRPNMIRIRGDAASVMERINQQRSKAGLEPVDTAMEAAHG